MVCLGCHRLSAGRLCRSCIASLRDPPERILDGGLRLVAAFEHSGIARRLVHDLKYRGVVHVAGLFADHLPDVFPAIPLVPVPRVLTRRVRYGVDPAHEIAWAIAKRTGAPVLDLLRAPLHSPRRAGGDHRSPVRFRSKGKRLVSEVALVDDVVTTGATITAAAEAMGRDRVRFAVAANVVPGGSKVRSRGD